MIIFLMKIIKFLRQKIKQLKRMGNDNDKSTPHDHPSTMTRGRTILIVFYYLLTTTI